MKPTSDTPRTDAAEMPVGQFDSKYYLAVLPDFARELERECALWKGRAHAEADGYGELLQACGTFNQKEALAIIKKGRGA